MNVPDDYHTYWTTCPDCGARVHPASQPDCDCEVCEECDRIVCECQHCECCGDPVPADDLLCCDCADSDEWREDD